jgi:hypothetical protein
MIKKATRVTRLSLGLRVPTNGAAKSIFQR